MPNVMAALLNMFNAAKFGWRPILECRAVTLPRRETRWNYLGCPKLPDRSQPLVGRSSPYCGDMWKRYEVWQTSNLRRLRLGEEKKKDRRRRNYRMKIWCPHLLRRAAIIMIYYPQYWSLVVHYCAELCHNWSFRDNVHPSPKWVKTYLTLYQKWCLHLTVLPEWLRYARSGPVGGHCGPPLSTVANQYISGFLGGFLSTFLSELSLLLLLLYQMFQILSYHFI